MEIDIDLAKAKAVEIKEGKSTFAIPETFDIGRVPIFAAGKWNGENYTATDLDDMVAAFEETKNYMKPYLKLGHDENQKLAQKDGLPAVGWIDRIYKEGRTLFADFSRVPKKVYDLVKAGAYRKISSEIWWNFNFNGKTYRRMLKAASFLGSDWPGVSTLDDIIALYAVNGEVKAYGGEGDLKTFDIEKEYMEVDMDELQKKYAEVAQKLAEADVKLKEYAAKEEKFTATEKELSEAKAALEKANASVSEFSTKAKEAEVNATLDKAVTDKKISPAQKPALFALLMNAESEKKYKVGDAEKTPADLLKEFINANSVSINTETNTETGNPQATGEDNSAAFKAAKDYAEKNKVSFKEALIAVSPASKAE